MLAVLSGMKSDISCISWGLPYHTTLLCTTPKDSFYYCCYYYYYFHAMGKGMEAQRDSLTFLRPRAPLLNHSSSQYVSTWEHNGKETARPLEGKSMTSFLSFLPWQAASRDRYWKIILCIFCTIQIIKLFVEKLKDTNRQKKKKKENKIIYNPITQRYSLFALVNIIHDFYHAYI